MDLILWPHAEAEEGADDERQGRFDLERTLTQRGERPAAHMARWLDRQ